MTNLNVLLSGVSVYPCKAKVTYVKNVVVRSGEIGRGHSVIKAAMEMLLNKAGCNVRIEEPILSNDDSKFMDILATGLYPTPTAIDVTVINTVRASAFNASNNPVLNGLLDEAAEVKNRK